MRTASIMLGAALLAATGPASAGVPIATLKSAASGGDSEAAFALGRAYRTGDDVPADNREAERWLEKAARLGHRQAGNELGMVLLQNGKPHDALPWLKRAAESGDRRAQYGLATLLFSGSAGVADKAEARRWMSKAARSGLPAAAEALAIMSDLPAPSPRYQMVSVPAHTTKPSLPPTGAWRVQLGAFAKEKGPERMWAQAARDGLQPFFLKGSAVTRLQAGPFASQAEAQAFCAQQRRHSRDCFALKAGDGTA